MNAHPSSAEVPRDRACLIARSRPEQLRSPDLAAGRD